MIWLRSLVFNVVFYVNLIGQMLIYLPVLALPRAWGWWIVPGWARSSLWLLRVVAGTRIDIRGRENLPRGSFLVAAKHQSLWETFALIPLFRLPAFVLKQELNWIPFFGWYAMKFRMIGIRRGSGGRGVRSLLEAAREALAHEDRQIIIFPEGTRRPVGAPPHYRVGIGALYADTGLPCVPIALNSGLFWPRRRFLRYPGTVTLEILEPIPPGLDQEAFMRELQTRIETATDRLVEEARALSNR